MISVWSAEECNSVVPVGSGCRSGEGTRDSQFYEENCVCSGTAMRVLFWIKTGYKPVTSQGSNPRRTDNIFPL